MLTAKAGPAGDDNDGKDRAAKEAQFRAWTASKTVRDKAFELLPRLDPAVRAGNAEKVKGDRDGVTKDIIEVAVSLAAAARFVGEVDRKPIPGETPTKTLRGEFFKWVNEHHTFCNVPLTDKDQAGFSRAMDDYLRCPVCAELFEGTGCKHPTGDVYLPSLQYYFPDEKKPGERQAKPLTPDQKRNNIIFARESQKLWEAAHEQVRERLNAKGGTDPQGLLADLSIKRLREWVEEDEDRQEERDKKEVAAKKTMASKMHKQYVEKKGTFLIRLPDPADMPKPPEPAMSNQRAGPESQQPVRPTVDAAAKCTVDMMGQSGQKYVYAADETDLRKSRLRLLELGIVLKENFDEDPDSEFSMARYRDELKNNPVLLERQYMETKGKEDAAQAYEDWMQLKAVRENCQRYLTLVKPPTLSVSARDLGGLAALGSVATGSAAAAAAAGGPGSRQPSAVAAGGPLVDRDPGLKLVIQVGQALKRADRSLFPEYVKWCEGVRGPAPVPGDKDWTPVYASSNPPPVPSFLTPNVLVALWDAFDPVACDVHTSSTSQVRDAFAKLMRPGLDFRQAFTTYADGLVGRIADPEKRKAKRDAVALDKDQLAALLREMGVAMKPVEMRALVDAFDADGDGTVTLQEFLDFTGPKREKKGGALQAMGQRCCWRTTCRVTGMPHAYGFSDVTAKAAKELDRQSNSVAGSVVSASGVRREVRSKMKADADVRTSNDSDANHADGNGSGNGGGVDENALARGSMARSVQVSGFIKTEVVIMKNGERRMRIESKERQRRYDLLVAILGTAITDRVAGAVAADAAAGGDGASGGRRGVAPAAAIAALGVIDEDNYEDSFDQGEGKEERKGGGEGKEGEREEGKADDNKSRASGSGAGERCAAGTWTNAQRRDGARYLNELTAEAQQEELLLRLINSGTPPQPPRLWDGSHAPPEHLSVAGSAAQAGDGNLNLGAPAASCTELRVCWAPAKAGDLVSFFSVEFAGAVGGGPIRGDRYKEIVRDPEDAAPGNAFAGTLIKTGLQPGTSYAFRIRAFNGFGAGDFTYKILTTVPAQPPCPRVTSVSSDSVTLRWTFSAAFLKRMDDLKKMFRLADPDNTGQVTREAFEAALDARRPGAADLIDFMLKIALKAGVDVARDGAGALFDQMEADDDGVVRWKEFEAFFMNAGWAAGGGANESMLMGGHHADDVDGEVGGDGATSLRGSREGSIASRSRAGSQAGSAAAMSAAQQSAQSRPRDITYVVERCEDEFRDVWSKAASTSLGQAALHRLEAGQSFRFRVYAVNVDGVEGQRSESVVVHTMIELPAAPTVVLKSLNSVYPRPDAPDAPPEECASLFLTWKARAAGQSTRTAKHEKRALGKWSGAPEEAEGVDVQAVFAKYDVDRTGSIDMNEFENILTDLAVPVSSERMDAIFRDYDKDGNKVLSFEEFLEWWHDDKVDSVIKRSDPVAPLTVSSEHDGHTSRAQSLIDRVQEALSHSLVSYGAPPGAEGGGGQRDGVGIVASQARPARSQSASRARPPISAAASRAAAAAAAAKSAPKGKLVPLPHAYPQGTKSRCEMTGLKPNSVYHFRVRYVGPRSNSLLSDALVVMTAPLPPPQPQVVTVSAVSARVKIYPPPCGAYRFIVQLLPTNVAAKNALKNIFKDALGDNTAYLGGKIGANADIHGANNEWVSVYYGPETLWVSTTLVADSDYQCRIFAVNNQGVVSDPSPVQSFSTLRRTDGGNGNGAMPAVNQSHMSVVGGLGPITARTAEQLFTIECTGDICVGDTVLITERLFYKERSSAAAGPSAGSNNNNANNGGGNAVALAAGANGVKSVRGPGSAVGKTVQMQGGGGGGGGGGGVVNVSAEGVGGGRSQLTATVRMDMSVTSLSTAARGRRERDGAADGPTPGSFIGERTVAAYVVKDNYRSTRDEVARLGLTAHPRDATRFGKYRRLWLEVIWTKSSNEAAKAYDLKAGVVIERQQSHLEQFEVFRTPWPLEGKRRRLVDEWEAMRDCYKAADV